MNDDHLFPSQSKEQIPNIGDTGQEWAIEKILAHRGSHLDTTFEVQWASGDRSWVPYRDLECLHPLKEYFEALGVDSIENLWEVSEALPGDDPQVSLGHVKFAVPHSTHHIKPRSLCPSAPLSSASHSAKTSRTPALAHSHPYTHHPSHTPHPDPVPGLSANHPRTKHHGSATHPQAPQPRPTPPCAELCTCYQYCPQCPNHCPC